MQVIRAKHAGACYGVQRALDMAYAAILDEEPVVTLGPLIHNPQVVQELSEEGLKQVSSVDEVQKGIVIIRSHGVVPQVKHDALVKGLSLVDATCPHVARAQKAAASFAREGYNVIIVGEPGHPEVEGMRAYALAEGTAAKVFVITDASELPAEIPEPVGIVVQTTQARENLDSIVQSLSKRKVEFVTKNTICFATRQRQEAAAELASKVDAVVVIGGRNSSNTTRLHEICKQYCEKSFHIERLEEINPAWFDGCESVGITAGASTPEKQIIEVETYLLQLGK